MRLAVFARKACNRWADRVFKKMADGFVTELVERFDGPDLFLFEGPVLVVFSNEVYMDPAFKGIAGKWMKRFYLAGFTEFGVSMATASERKAHQHRVLERSQKTLKGENNA